MKAKVVDHLFKKLDSRSNNFRNSEGRMIFKSAYLKAIEDLVEFYAEEEQKKTNKDCSPS